jgi:hypothetical protein
LEEAPLEAPILEQEQELKLEQVAYAPMELAPLEAALAPLDERLEAEAN